MPEHNQLFEIYSSAREMPISFRDCNRVVKIKNLALKEIRNDVIEMFIEVFWI